MFDSNDGTFWLAAKGAVRHLITQGASLTYDDIALPADPDGLAIDQASGHLAVLQNAVGGTLVCKVDKADGATLASAAIAEIDRDHPFFDLDSPNPILTAGQQYSAGASPSRVLLCSNDGENFMDPVGSVLLPEAVAIESVVLHALRL